MRSSLSNFADSKDFFSNNGKKRITNKYDKAVIEGRKEMNVKEQARQATKTSKKNMTSYELRAEPKPLLVPQHKQAKQNQYKSNIF